MMLLQLHPCASNNQATTSLNTYTIIHVWVWENFFPCLRSSELLMTTIFSTTKGSLQLLQSSLSDGTNSFPKVLLISLSAILCYELCSSLMVLNFTLWDAWKGMEKQGLVGLSGCVKIKSQTEVIVIKLQLFNIFRFPERKVNNRALKEVTVID